MFAPLLPAAPALPALPLLPPEDVVPAVPPPPEPAPPVALVPDTPPLAELPLLPEALPAMPGPPAAGSKLGCAASEHASIIGKMHPAADKRHVSEGFTASRSCRVASSCELETVPYPERQRKPRFKN